MYFLRFIRAAVFALPLCCCCPGAEFLGMSPADPPPAQFTVTMLDAGPQPGDIFLLHSPDGQTTLIDAGFEVTATDALVAPLRRRGIARLDRVIITHAHDDHIGGLVYLLKDGSIPIGEILWSNPSDENIRRYGTDEAVAALRDLTAVRKLAQQRGIPIREVAEGEVLDLGGGVTATVLMASRPEPIASYFNNNSLILKVAFQDFSMLFTGDLCWEQEALLLPLHPDLTVDVLKIPHHGGAYWDNEKFVAATHAKAALIPTPEWLARDPRSEPGRKILNAHRIPSFASWEYPELDLATDGTVCWLSPAPSGNP